MQFINCCSAWYGSMGRFPRYPGMFQSLSSVFYDFQSASVAEHADVCDPVAIHADPGTHQHLPRSMFWHIPFVNERRRDDQRRSSDTFVTALEVSTFWFYFSTVVGLAGDHKNDSEQCPTLARPPRDGDIGDLTSMHFLSTIHGHFSGS